MIERKKGGTTIRSIEYDMQGQPEQSIDLYKELAQIKELPFASTPFLEEDDVGNSARKLSSLGNGLMSPWCRSCLASEDFAPYDNTGEKGNKREKESVITVGGGNATADNTKSNGGDNATAGTKG